MEINSPDRESVHFDMPAPQATPTAPPTAQPPDSHEPDTERRIARRLAWLRGERGWSLGALADRTGISRATLSRLERCELSPTASMLVKLCAVYGWTLSRLMAEAESRAPSFVGAAEQPEWQDPETGYRRRAVSPPARGLRGELVEIRIPPGASVSFDVSPVPGLEHHLWMLDGTLMLEIERAIVVLKPGDCYRYVLAGPTRFQSVGKREARYVVAMVRP
jgi:transcriptional regulator with XRE-family HTH domain